MVAFELLLVKLLLALVLLIFAFFVGNFLSEFTEPISFFSVSIPLGSLSLMLDALLLDFVIDLHRLESCRLSVLLPELCLHVSKESARQNPDVCDLNCLQMDAPALHDVAHILDDAFSELVAILDDLVDGRV